jgi:hypothetical protein
MVARDNKFAQQSSLNTGTKKRMVMARSITIPRILKRWSNPDNILDKKDNNTSR